MEFFWIDFHALDKSIKSHAYNLMLLQSKTMPIPLDVVNFELLKWKERDLIRIDN